MAESWEHQLTNNVSKTNKKDFHATATLEATAEANPSFNKRKIPPNRGATVEASKGAHVIKPVEMIIL